MPTSYIALSWQLLRPILLVLVVATCALAANERQADELAQKGLVAMQQWDEDPLNGVTATLDLLKARELYQQAESWEKYREVSAQIFWCKKKMTNDQIDAYLNKIKDDHKGDRRLARSEQRTVQSSLRQADALVNASVTSNDANRFYAQAELFAEKNPKNYFGIYVCFYEVQERFMDHAPEVSGKALGQAAKYFELYRKELSSGASFDPAKIFSPPTTGVQQVPNRVELRDYNKQVRSLFAKQLRAKGDELAALPQQILNAAIDGESNPGLAYATALLAAEVAAKRGVEDLLVLEKTAKWLIANYQGLEYREVMKGFLATVRSNEAAKALKTLLDDPENAEASLQLGLYYALALKKRQMGWNLIVKGEQANANLARIGKMELAKPQQAIQQKELADNYLALAQHRDFRRAEDLKQGAYQRAMYWLKKAAPNLKGVDRKTVDERMADIATKLPLDMSSINWKKIDQDTWVKLFKDLKKLGGVAIEVRANTKVTPTGVVLAEGDKVRVVPHPGAHWTFRSDNGSQLRVNPYGPGVIYHSDKLGRGTTGHVAYTFSKSGKTHNTVVGEVITGSGPLYLHPNQPRCSHEMSGKGVCPVLIIPIFDEE